MGSESPLTKHFCTRPRSSSGEETLFLRASLHPVNSGLEVIRSGLLYGEPSIRERFRIVSNETQPMFFFPRWDPVRFGQNACKWDRSVRFPEEDGSSHTNRSLSLGVILFCNVMCALVLKVRYRGISTRKKKEPRTYFRM